MDRATLTADLGANTGWAAPDDIAARKRHHELGRLSICRDAISGTDTSDRESWKQIVCELIDGGFEESEIEAELAASRNTIYKWKSGMAAPREMTRRLLRRSILEMVDERIDRLKSRG